MPPKIAKKKPKGKVSLIEILKNPPKKMVLYQVSEERDGYKLWIPITQYRKWAKQVRKAVREES